MNSDPSSLENDPDLSGLGRALLGSGTGTGSGSRPSGPWVPPTAEELHQILPQYEIVKMLGRGGMGAVYMGTQTALDRPVAIKILSAALEDSDAGFAERFKNEARAMAKLNHPGIVSVYDFGEAPGGLLYIVMEYVDGTDVARMIAGKGRLHTEHAMAVTAHVCDALAYAHERGIIHRDIKPANIMVGYDGAVKVADFGLAKVNVGGNTLGLTQSGMAMGTLHYMAPEALMLGTSVDHRADIYAVGVMLYQMLSGKVPHGMFQMPSFTVPGLDPRYDRIIQRAMMEDREARYQSARELRSDLDGILTQPVAKLEPAAAQSAAVLPTQARPQRPGVRTPQPPGIASLAAQPKKRGFPLGAAVLLLLLAGATWFFFFKPKTASTAGPPAGSVTTRSLAQIRVLTPDPARILKLEKGQPRLYDSTPLRVIEGVAAGLAGWQFTSIPQRIDNEYTIHVEKAGVIYAFGAVKRGTTPQDALGSDHALWKDAQGDITGAMVQFCYKRNVSAGEILKFKAFELQFAAPTISLEASTPAMKKEVSSITPAAATQDQPYLNSLGMKLVPVPGTNVLFCIHETRFKDYLAYTAENPAADMKWKDQTTDGHALAGGGDDHPVSKINWHDAEAFCRWLSKKESRRYRLPTDAEWSVAAGLDEQSLRSPEDTPKSLSDKGDRKTFPWGATWPPPAGAGNYSDETRQSKAPRQGEGPVPGYNDGWATTAPVMTFAPNQLGLHDMGGNVLEWVEEWWVSKLEDRKALRGGAWSIGKQEELLSSFRAKHGPDTRFSFIGFRIVLELPGGKPMAQAAAPLKTDAKEDGFVRLFQNDSIAGWSGDLSSYRLRDGILGGGKGNLTSSKEYGDFTLKFDMRLLPGAYAEMSIRGQNPPQPNRGAPNASFGIVLRDDAAAGAGESEPWKKHGAIYGYQGPLKTAPNPVGAWNEYEITVEKQHVTVLINGAAVQDTALGGLTRQAPGGRSLDLSRTRGQLAILGFKGGAEFRNMRVKELMPAAGVAAAVPPTPAASSTLWVDIRGRTLDARFVRMEEPNVLLSIAGKTTPVPLASLSLASQQIARDLAAAMPAAKPASVDWLIGTWHQTNDGRDYPIHLLEFKTDHTASFLGGRLHVEGSWKLESGVITMEWSNGARYRIEVPSSTPSDHLEGMIFDIDGKAGTETPTRMRKVDSHADTGWAPLFPNDSLSGWTGDTASYRAINGVFVCTGTGDLVSPKQYSNFHLKFDLRLGAETNNGLGIWRTGTTGATADATQGFEVQILDDTAPKFKSVDYWQRHGGIYYFREPAALPMGPVGSWNTHEIRVQGTQVEVIINGRHVQNADLSTLRPLVTRAPVLDISRKRGHLAFLGRSGTAEFRNMQIKELP